MRHYKFHRAVPGSRGEQFQTRELFGGTTEDLTALLDDGWHPAIEGGAVDTFTADGTWTVPTGVTSAVIEAWGGGAGGSNNTLGGNSGAGGGGGAYATSTLQTTPTDVWTITCGSAPAAEINGPAGKAEAPALVKAAGGSVNTGVSTGGAGGTTAASIGATKFAGGNGGSGTNSGGGGGSSAGTAAAGNNGANSNEGTSTGGAGGTAPTGGGAGGAGGNNSTGGTGTAGSAPGGGGGGGSNGGFGGAAGAAGKVVIVDGGGTTTITTPGTTEYRVPAGTTSITVECWGSGAGGYGFNAGHCPGGGGGAYAKTTNIPVTAGETFEVVVGAGGSSSGGQGAASSVQRAVVGAGGTASASNTGGATAAGGTTAASVGATKFAGGNGGNGSTSFSVGGGGGGSSAGTAAGGNNGSANSGATGGAGGTAPTGGVAGGAGGNNSASGSNAPSAIGGGGGGGKGFGGTAGGNGSSGKVVITYTSSTTVSASDSGTETEASALSVTQGRTDSGAGSEASSEQASYGRTDSGALSEAASVVDLGVTVAGSDSATQAQVAALASSMAASDSHALAEARALSAALGASDTVVFSESAHVDHVRIAVSIRRNEVPMALEVEVVDSAGRKLRWGPELPAHLRPTGLQLASSIPGGYSTASMQLPRDLRRSYHDLGLLRDVRVLAPGGQPVWEGRVQETPGSGGGAESTLSLNAEGHAANLRDDASFIECFVDRDLQSWRGISTARRAALIEGDSDPKDGSIYWDVNSQQPVIGMQHDGAARNVSPITENWWDGGGVILPAKVFYDYAPLANAGATLYYIETDPNFNAHIGNAADEAISGSWEGSGELAASHGTSGYLTFGTPRRYLFIQFSWEQTTWGHTLGYVFAIRWAKLAVYGNHGLPLSGSDPKGVLASDVIGYALEQVAPELNYTVGDSIETSTFVIPQLIFREPTTAEAVILAVTAMGGAQNRPNDWGVYDGKTFFWKSPGTYGKTWRVRTGTTTKLNEEGPQMEDAIDGVIVQWQDATGLSHTIGPPGSGMEAEDATLLDTDPENPAVAAGIKRRPTLSIGTTTYPIALQVGALFLAEAKQRKLRGEVAHEGPIMDSRGIFHPPSLVKAGDQVEIVNLPDPGPFRIIGVSYGHDGRSVSMALDAPPARLDVMLERLQTVLAGAGV